MPLVPTVELMDQARAAGHGLGAFNVIHLETAEAFAEAAERSGHPVILQISENCALYHRALAPLALGALEVARRSSAPVAVHLDHAEDASLVDEAIALGFGSVMFDGAKLDFGENVRTTADVTRSAHAHGVYVEAELGEVGGKDGAHAPGVRTDPDAARDYVGRTGVDALAVAVGSSHAMVERVASLDLELIALLRDAVPVPLVLHGSSGVPDETITAAIRAGMTKINVSTHLNAHFTRAVRDHLAAHPDVVDSRTYLAAGRRAVAAEAQRLLTMLSSVPTPH
jgi:fructose-bisphosphate aldolase class II